MMAEPLEGALANQVCLLSHDIHQAQDGGVQRGLIPLAQEWQEFVANSVSLKVQESIRGILTKADLQLGSKTLKLSPRHIQERTDKRDSPVARGRTAPGHTRQALSPATAQEAQEEQLELIVGVMCQRDSGVAEADCRAGQEIVSQPAPCHFDGNPLGARKVTHAAALHHSSQAQLSRRLADQTLVGVTAPPPEPMVEMGNGEAPIIPRSQLLKDMKQHHGIHATGNGHQYALSATEQPPRPNGFFNVLLKSTHA